MNVIYRNIWIYRAVMTVLYRELYTKRFNRIIAILSASDRSIVELCFGDICIADHCFRTKKRWKGIDINASFISFAKKRGFDAEYGDIMKLSKLPEADVCIMGGSLYHFHASTMHILSLMLASAPKIIISEPVTNITSIKGVIGNIASKASNAGNGAESFRYTKKTFTEMLETASEQLKFTSDIISEGRDILVRITRNGS